MASVMNLASGLKAGRSHVCVAVVVMGDGRNVHTNQQSHPQNNVAGGASVVNLASGWRDAQCHVCVAVMGMEAG